MDRCGSGSRETKWTEQQPAGAAKVLTFGMDPTADEHNIPSKLWKYTVLDVYINKIKLK